MERLYCVQPDGCIICPYNRSHVITSVRFVYHLMKCSKSSGKSFEICPFNAQHHIVEPYTLKDHVPSCRSKAHAETERTALAMGEPMTIQRREEHLKYEESARIRFMEAMVRERRRAEGAEEALPSWLQDALGPVDNSQVDKPVANGHDDLYGQFAGAEDDEAAVVKDSGCKPVPAYAIEAENLLREEYSREYARTSAAERCRTEQSILLGRSRPVGLGRAQSLGLVPIREVVKPPLPRTVPHQYMLDINTQINLEIKQQYLDGRAQNAGIEPISEVKLPAPLPVPAQYMLDINKQSDLEIKTQYEDALCAGAEPASISSTSVASPKSEDSIPSESYSEDVRQSTQDSDLESNKESIESKESQEEEEKFNRELSELELVFYSTSLPNFPRVTEAFKLMMETAKKEMRLQK